MKLRPQFQRPALGVNVLTRSMSGILGGERYVPILDEATSQPASFVTFTRTTTASRYNSAGLLETVAANQPRIDYDPATVTRANLLKHSQAFDNAVWGKSALGTASVPVVTAEAAAAPDGSMTADRVVLALNGGTTTGDYSHLTQGSLPWVAGSSHVFSIWMRTADGTTKTVRLDANGYAGGNVVVTGEWQRFSVDMGVLDTSVRPITAPRLRGGMGTSDYADLYVWGAQLETGSVTTDYIPTGVLERGPEVLVNGDFEAGSTGWSVSGADATHIATFADGKLRYQSDTTSPVLLVGQAAPGAVLLQSGAVYEITTVVSTYVSGNIKTDAMTEANLTLATGPGVNIVYGTGKGLGFSFLRGTPNVDMTIDSISVRKINADYNSPRGNATLRGLLIEEQRTNLLLRSQEFDNASWAKTEATVTANAAVAPDGTLSADRLVPSTNAAAHYINQGITSATTQHSASIYVKADGSAVDKITLYPGGAATFGHFDLTTLAHSGEANVSSTSMTAVGGGWYRLTVTWTAGVTIDRLRVYASSGSIGAATTAGDGVSGPYIWGAQLEAGEFTTSYIPTTSATVTRAGDFASVTNLANIGFNAASGTVSFDGTPAGVRSSTSRFLEFNDGTVNNRNPLFYASGAGTLVAQFRNGGIDQAVLAMINVFVAGTRFKGATAWAANDFALAANGIMAVGDTSGTIASANTLNIGWANSSGSEQYSGHIRSVRYYPRRLSDAQLQALTA